MLFCPSSVQDTKTLIIIINRTIIYDIQMLADGRIGQFWMPGCCAVTVTCRLTCRLTLTSKRADLLYQIPLTSVPSFPEGFSVELMELASKSVSFSFNDTMYGQVDWISTGSPLGPNLANIFVGFYEKLLFDRFHKPYIYFRNVDDTFACFSSPNEALSFFQRQNDLHPSLTFTMDEEKDN